MRWIRRTLPPPPPAPSECPVDIERPDLYGAQELYDALLAGGSYSDTLDASAYAWSRLPATPERTLAQALHDHAVDEALSTWIHGRRMVGVMGGHDVPRGSPLFADAARVGHLLGGRFTVATGGGPGAMEAANLGARFAAEPAERLARALVVMARVASYTPDITAWAASAFEALNGLAGTETLGIPTWFYGHEPSNIFATDIAKYFRNATREAILLQICDAGIVFLPGAAGTVQEIFQDACENYYSAPGTVAPMVLVGTEHWTTTLPAWPLLRSLARGRHMEHHVFLVDTLDEAAANVLGQAATGSAPRSDR